jgi:putative component of membrane protein insertase Oxa1/YidC/SpoIIIJ protein YidD
MKSIAAAVFYLYQGIESIKHSILMSVFGYHIVCKHRPTCSQYTIKQIKNSGTISGLWQGFKRILTCW